MYRIMYRMHNLTGRMSLELMAIKIRASIDRLILKEIPVESCPVKEAKNKWKREKLRAMIMGVTYGPTEYKGS